MCSTDRKLLVQTAHCTLLRMQKVHGACQVQLCHYSLLTVCRRCAVLLCCCRYSDDMPESLEYEHVQVRGPPQHIHEPPRADLRLAGVTNGMC
jgi:hypothetical protein